MKFTRSILALAALASLSFQARAEDAAEETWKSIGTGLYRENFLQGSWSSLDYYEIPVELMESEQTPGRYRIMNPYANYPKEVLGSPGCADGEYYMTIDASDPERVYLEYSITGFYGGIHPETGGKQILLANSMAYDYFVKDGNWSRAEQENRFGRLEDGAITFPPNSLLYSYWDTSREIASYDETTWGIVDSRGMFRLKLPGAPDLDITTTVGGINDDKTQLIFDVTFGKDIEHALVALVPGRNEQDDAAEIVLNGEVESKELYESGIFTLPYTVDGFYTLTVIPYWQGEPRRAHTRTMEVLYNEDVWRKAGKAFFREGIVSGVGEMMKYGFVYPTTEYYVEVEESVEHHGLIRLVDPYGEGTPLSDYYGNDTDSSRHYYLVLNATDPDFVRLEHMTDMGLDLGYGRMEIWSKSDRLMDNNDPKYISLWEASGLDDYGLLAKAQEFSGTFANNEITFPKASLSYRFPEIHPDAWYEANYKNEFLVRFEEGQILGKQSAGVGEILGEEFDGPAEYFRLDGTRASENDLTPGLYIVRQGSKSFKTVIR